MKLSDIKKVMTGIYPTPLEKMDNLTRQVNKAQLFIKRDDLTGLGFGGNKSRKLDYIVKDAIDNGCTTLLTYGGPHTNHGRMTAAAAVKFGLKSIIMCYGEPPEVASGNIVLDSMLGTEICFMNTTKIRNLPKDRIVEAYYKLRDDSTKEIIEKYEAKGEKVYIVPIGGHSGIGTLGYVDAIEEIMEQLSQQDIQVDYLVTGYGSSGTFAGLWLGAKYHKAPFKIIGVSVAPIASDEAEKTSEFINKVSEEFELGVECNPEDLWIEGGYYSQGYNIPDSTTREYMYMLAQTEGIFLDPCYSGKSFRGFLDLVEKERIPSNSTAIFLHTGGTPGIFTKEHLDALQEELWDVNKLTMFDYKE